MTQLKNFKAVLVAGAVALFVAAPAAADNLNDVMLFAAGEKFESEDGNFSIEFPGTPQVESTDVETEVGTIEMHTFMYEKSVTEAFMVAISDYPSSLIEMSNPNELLEGGKSGALESLGINNLEEEKEIDLKGHPGKYFKGNNGSFFVVYRMYLVKNRLYQIAVLKDGGYPIGKDVDKFFKSFKLLKQVKVNNAADFRHGFVPSVQDSDIRFGMIGSAPEKAPVFGQMHIGAAVIEEEKAA